MGLEMWQPVPDPTTWREIAPGAVLAYDDNDAVVIDSRFKDHDQISLKLQRLDGERYTEQARADKPIHVRARKLFASDSEVRVVTLPAVIWRDDGLFAPRNLAAIAASVAVATLMITQGGAGQLYLAFLSAGFVAVGVRRLFKEGNELSFLAPDRLGITMETVHDFALAREQGKLWVPPTAGADPRQLAFRRVEAIRQRYLELREDIAYRIECSALFDPIEPTTAEFESALVAFDDVNDQTPTDELDLYASEVEVTFNVAQANAERLGLSHLPESARDDARRAGKAARLATNATSEGERQASLSQVRRILDALAIYYLPRLDERLALEQGQATPTAPAPGAVTNTNADTADEAAAE